MRFCPRCGAAADIEAPRSITCPECGYGLYFNPKPVACVIPRTQDERILLIRRGFQPRRGHWSMPGGFVDLGETVEDAARRECMEEMGIDVEITRLIGVYSHAHDRVIVVVYAGRALGTPALTEEALEIGAFAPSDIPWRELAFSSDERALRAHLDSGAG